MTRRREHQLILSGMRHDASAGRPSATPERLADVWRAAQAEDDPVDLAETAHRIATRFRDDLEDYDRAESFAREALLLEERLDRAHAVANHTMFLADLLRRAGRYPEALGYARRGYALYRDLYGEDNSEVGFVLSVVRNLERKCPDQH